MGLLAKQRAIFPTRIIDAPELVALIKAHKPSLLVPWQENLSEYCRRLEQTFHLHLDYKALGLQEQPVLEDFYVDVNLLLRNEVVYMRPWEKDATYIAVFETAEAQVLSECRDTLEAACGIRLKVSERRETVTTMKKTIKGVHGIERATQTYHEVKEEITVAFDVEYNDLAEKLWLCMSELEIRGLSGVRIDNRLADDDLAAITRGNVHRVKSCNISFHMAGG